MPRISKQGAALSGLPESTFVLDNGGYSIKAGYAPSAESTDEATLSRCRNISNTIVRTRDRKTYVAAQADEVTQWSEAIFKRPVENGQIVSWEAQKEIWEQSFFDQRTAAKDLLVSSPENTTLILADNPNALPALQKNADEIVMEEFGFGGYLRSNVQGLNAFNDLHPLFEEAKRIAPEVHPASPMECLLVVDSGYSHTVVTPVYNGRPIQRAIRRFDFGGKHLTNLMKEVISVRHFDLHQDTKIVNDIKEDVCFVSSIIDSDMESTWKGNKGRITHNDEMKLDRKATSDARVDYVLPDGLRLLRGFSRPHDPSAAAARKRKLNAMTADAEVSMTLGNERFTIPEILFSPSDIGSKQPGLPDMIMQSLATLPPLIQATMLSNVLFIGGNARLAGFRNRLESELRMLTKSDWAVRVRQMPDPVTSSWLGGARLASRHQNIVREYGVTRAEYLEHGSGWMARKFLSGG